MSHSKINLKKKNSNKTAAARRGLLWLAAHPSLPPLLETGTGRDGVHLHPVPLCLSARAACGGVPFTDSLGVSSGLCYWVITDANAAWATRRLRERGATQRGLHCSAGSERVIVPRRLCLFSAVTWHRQHLENLHRQQLLPTQLRNVRHHPSGRKWRREEPVRVTSLKKDFSIYRKKKTR